MVPCKPMLTCFGANLTGCNQLQTQHGTVVVSTGLSPSSDTVMRDGHQQTPPVWSLCQLVWSKIRTYMCLPEKYLTDTSSDWKPRKAWCFLSCPPSGQKWHELPIFSGTRLCQILFSYSWSWIGTWFQPWGHCAHFCSCFVPPCSHSKIKKTASGELPGPIQSYKVNVPCLPFIDPSANVHMKVGNSCWDLLKIYLTHLVF